MSRIRQIFLLSAVLFSLFALTGTLRAQTGTAQITGAITDPTGAVIPQVNVNIKNQRTGMTWNATTSGTGKYTVTALPVGVYNVTATKQGFRSAQRSQIRLSVGETAEADFSLAVGSVTQTVSIEANPVSIDTVSASQTQLVGERQISNLPLNGRNSRSS